MYMLVCNPMYVIYYVIVKYTTQYTLFVQVMQRLHEVLPDWSWGNGVTILTDIVRAILAVDDAFSEFRLRVVLMHPHFGLALLIASE